MQQHSHSLKLNQLIKSEKFDKQLHPTLMTKYTTRDQVARNGEFQMLSLVKMVQLFSLHIEDWRVPKCKQQKEICLIWSQK